MLGRSEPDDSAAPQQPGPRAVYGSIRFTAAAAVESHKLLSPATATGDPTDDAALLACAPVGDLPSQPAPGRQRVREESKHDCKIHAEKVIFVYFSKSCFFLVLQ